MKKVKLLCTCLVTSVLLSGCATTERTAETLSSIKMGDVLAEATTASNAGQSDKALLILKGATASFPADKAPWSQLAQMHFDRSNYSEAILSAQEVLQRDSNDKLANSIIAVSGLRLSNKALADLSRQNNLSGSLKTEAQDLAKLLRETLGESVLVPVRARATAPASKTSHANPRASIKNVPSAAAPKTDTATAASTSTGKPNPFGALK